jgi:hypothetical protein
LAFFNSKACATAAHAAEWINERKQQVREV